MVQSSLDIFLITLDNDDEIIDNYLEQSKLVQIWVLKYLIEDIYFENYRGTN